MLSKRYAIINKDWQIYETDINEDILRILESGVDDIEPEDIVCALSKDNETEEYTVVYVNNVSLSLLP